MRNYKKYYTKYWLPPILYCLMIFGQAVTDIPVSAFQRFDKLLHFGVYFLLGILIFRAFSTVSKSLHVVAVLIISVCVSALIGSADEMFQLFSPSRTIDRIDVLYDITGSLCGIIVFIFIRFIIRLRQNRAG